MLEKLDINLFETKNFLSINSPKDSIDKFKNSFDGVFQAASEASNVAIDKIGGITETAKNTLTDITNQGMNSVIKTADSAQNKLTNMANQAIEQVNNVTKQGVETVSETTEKAKSSLDGIMDKASQINETLTESVNRAITVFIQQWAENNRILVWMITHPLWTLGILLLFIFLFWGLFRFFARLSEDVWYVILKYPIQLSKFIFGSIFQVFKSIFKSKSSQDLSFDNNPKARLNRIVTRLDEIKTEEKELLEEMKTILSLIKSN